MGNSEPRVRPRPAERFAPAEDQVDLNEAVAQLWTEPNAGSHGHRQMALFHHGPATVALYCFEAGASLPDHVVDGSVTIHVLKGRLSVTTENGRRDLPAGHLLRLAPGVVHDVEASEQSEMLLTVCVEGPNSHREA
ncbi:MAG: cupin domain-containing protein [Phycisphaeraceae bacterium]